MREKEKEGLEKQAHETEKKRSLVPFNKWQAEPPNNNMASASSLS